NTHRLVSHVRTESRVVKGSTLQPAATWTPPQMGVRASNHMTGGNRIDFPSLTIMTAVSAKIASWNALSAQRTGTHMVRIPRNSVAASSIPPPITAGPSLPIPPNANIAPPLSLGLV